MGKLNQLAAELQALAEAKGFRDNIKDPHSVGAIAVYVENFHGEASELWEAARAGKLYDLCDKAEKMRCHGIAPLTCIQEELADMFIRVLDIGNVFGVDMDDAIATDYVARCWSEIRTTIEDGSPIEIMAQLLCKFHRAASDIENDGKFIRNRLPYRIGMMLNIVCHIANTCSVDLMRAVQLKHEFNKTRPYRHGGKLA